MTIRLKEKIKNTMLILQSIVVLTSTIILLSNVRHCEACGGRYISFNKENICDVCLDYKQAKINGIAWHYNNY